MNRTHCDYLPGYRPNVLVEVATGTTQYQPISGGIISLLDILTPKHPEWTFVSAIYSPQTVRVYKGDELLGIVSYRYAYEITCRSIKASMHRKNEKETRNVKRAVTIIEEHFKLLSSAEKIKSRVGELRGTSYDLIAKRRREIETDKNNIGEYLYAYAKANIATLAPQLRALGAPQDIVDAYAANVVPDQVDMYVAYNNAAFLQVVILDGAYHIIKLGNADKNGILHPYTEDQLPGDYKLAIGKLKLADEKTLVANVGIRIADDAFFVLESAVS